VSQPKVRIRQRADNIEAYVGMIRESNHCIYIENQFCESEAVCNAQMKLTFSVR
jgi:hypothetical protein